MNQTIPQALLRVVVTEDPAQEEAAQIRVDPTSRADIAYLTLNPDLVPEDAREGFKIRAAIEAVLESFRRYNRRMTRRYGTYDHEQALFDEAVAQARQELEELVHLSPTVSEVPEADVQVEPAPPEVPLPDAFPEAERLRTAGYRTLGAVQEATDEDLRAIEGVGKAKLEAIRAAQDPQE
ncbi:helix-hairpin-helix domain-containing protein [Deinococcus sp. UYEF24]